MKIGIIGLGLMGGSIAKALKSQHEIHALDHNPQTIEFALSNHIIDYGYQDKIEFFNAVQIVYICLYPRALVKFIKEAKNDILPGTVLIEISGVKTSVVNALEPYIDNRFELIYTHPVAGREKIGVASSSASIFTNANYIITPLDRNTTKNLELVDSLARSMGFTSVSYLSPEKHDEIIAYTSQLTHILSLALVLSDDQSFETVKFIGDSYRDLTRIAMINAPLWSELFMENKEILLKKIKNFKKTLEKYENCLESVDETQLIELMTAAKDIRLGMEKGASR
jgi:prephenate dehydrogenase